MTNPENINSVISIFKFFNKDNPETLAEELYKDEENARNAFIECTENTEISRWYDRVYNYLKSKVSEYEIKPIVLDDMFKAISTFEYINTRGTDLSTFDLLCAKAGVEFDLRKGVVGECVKPFRFFN